MRDIGELYVIEREADEGKVDALTRLEALKCSLLDGRVPIDNNACESAIRPVAIGRKNFLSAGSELGGEAAAIVYSVIESCRRAEVDRWEYLSDVLVRVATHPASKVADLLPARWAAIRATQAQD